MIRNVVIALTLILAAASTGGAAGTVDVDSLVHEVDVLYRAKSAYATVEMEIVTPHWQRTLSMDTWSEGLKKTFIRITAPAREKDVATLRVDNEMWNYLPKANKVMKIPPSMMAGSWMGSDFTNDDLVKESSFFDDYSYGLFEPDSADPDLWYIKCIPHENVAVVWGSVVIAIRKQGHIPVWQKYYDEKGNLMRVMTYSDVRTVDGRTIPMTLEMVPQNKAGHKTIIRYLELEFNVKLDPEIFSLRNLHAQP